MVEFPSFFSMYIIKNFSVFRDCRRPTRWFFLPLRFDTSQLSFVANLNDSVSLETAFSMPWMQSRVGERGSDRINFCSSHLVFLLFKNYSYVFVFLSPLFPQSIIFPILLSFPFYNFRYIWDSKTHVMWSYFITVDIGYY